MVRIATIGRTRYVWGLAWVDSDSRKPAQAAKALLDPKEEWVYVGSETVDGRLAFGYAPKPTDEGKGRLYSYAHSLAQVAEDGIYVAPIDDDHCWYVVVSQGSVVPDTDAIEDTDEALAKVLGLREAFDFPVKVAEGFSVGIAVDGTFDVDSVEGATGQVALSKIGGSGQAKKLAVLAALVVLVGGGAWFALHKDEVPVVVDHSAEQAAQLRANYLESIRGELVKIPWDGSWARAAAQAALSELPEVYAGWALREVECVPSGCTGIYVPGNDGPFSLSMLESRFQQGWLTRGAVAGEVQVTVPLDVGMGLTWDDDMILGGYTHGLHLTDLIGALPARLPGIELDGPVRQDDLRAARAAPIEAQTILKEQIALGARERLNPRRVNYVAAEMAQAGFSPMALNYTTGAGSSQPVWSLTVARITGAH